MRVGAGVEIHAAVDVEQDVWVRRCACGGPDEVDCGVGGEVGGLVGEVVFGAVSCYGGAGCVVSHKGAVDVSFVVERDCWRWRLAYSCWGMESDVTVFRTLWTTARAAPGESLGGRSVCLIAIAGARIAVMVC